MTQISKKYGLRKIPYSFVRFLIGIGCFLASGIECSFLPYCYFLVGVLITDWLFIEKLGHRDAYLFDGTYEQKKERSSHEQRMMKYRRIAVPLSFVLLGCWYVFSKKHRIDWPLPVLFYSGLIVIHAFYSLYRYGYLTASPLADGTPMTNFDSHQFYSSQITNKLLPFDSSNPYNPYNPTPINHAETFNQTNLFNQNDYHIIHASPPMIPEPMFNQSNSLY